MRVLCRSLSRQYHQFLSRDLVEVEAFVVVVGGWAGLEEGDLEWR